MPTLQLNVLYGKNKDLILNPDELRDLYLSGIPMCGSDGKEISSNSIANHIAAAQTKIENLFSIKLNKQVIAESRDFVREEFAAWGFVRTMYPIVNINRLDGYLNDVAQVHYPKEWLTIKKTTQVAVFRNVQLLPNTGSGAMMTQNSFMYSGITPHLSFYGSKFIPNYWRLNYITGWDKTPNDLLDFIAKAAACNVLGVLGDILYGVGLTSISITLDGVSQNTPLTRSAQGGLFAGRIKQYVDEMNQVLPALKNQYRGITFEVL